MPNGPGSLTIRIPVTTSGALAAGGWQPIDASSGSLTFTLPTGLARVGARIRVERIDNATANTVTITGKIRGVANSSITLRAAATGAGDLMDFEYEGNDSWRPAPAHRPKGVNDTFYEPIGAAAGAMSSHVGATDPHPQYARVAEKGSAGGLATLGSDGKVPTGQLPTLNASNPTYASLSAFPATGVTGLIYVAADTNQLYRWTGSAYVSVGSTSGSGTVTSVAGKQGSVTLVKADVGLSNVDNTADTAKPISTATQAALDLKLNAAARNAANGVAGLDSSGLIPAALLPSYVDDVLEYATLSAFPTTGETGKIYVAIGDNKTYRWSGSTYVEISPSPGSTDSVPEGSTNRYYTDARVLAAVQAAGYTTGGGGGATEIVDIAYLITSRTGLFVGGTTPVTSLSGLTTSTHGLGITFTAGDLVAFSTRQFPDGGSAPVASSFEGKIMVASTGTWTEATAYDTAAKKVNKIFHTTKGPADGYYLFYNAPAGETIRFDPIRLTKNGYIDNALMQPRLSGSANVSTLGATGSTNLVGAALSGWWLENAPTVTVADHGGTQTPTLPWGIELVGGSGLGGVQFASTTDSGTLDPLLYLRGIYDAGEAGLALTPWQRVPTMMPKTARTLTTIAAPGTTVSYTNTSLHVMQITTSGGTVTNIEKAHDGTTFTSILAGTNNSFLLLPGEAARWTYSAAPTIRRQSVL